MSTTSWAEAPLYTISTIRAGDAISRELVDAVHPYPVYGSNGIRGHAAQYNQTGPKVLVGRQGTLGEVHHVEGEFWASEHALVLSPAEGHLAKWLTYELHIVDFDSLSNAVAQPGVSATAVGQVRIPLPPLPTQRAIADYLDRETAQIDAMATELDEMIALLGGGGKTPLRGRRVLRQV